MYFLILLLLALSFFLFYTFKLFKQRKSWRYLVLLLIIDTWLSIVLVYLLYSAALG